MSTDVFPTDIPRDARHAHAVRLYRLILKAHPETDAGGVAGCLENWLRAAITLEDIERHIERLESTAKQLAADASKLARQQRETTESILAAARPPGGAGRN